MPIEQMGVQRILPHSMTLNTDACHGFVLRLAQSGAMGIGQQPAPHPWVTGLIYGSLLLLRQEEITNAQPPSHGKRGTGHH
jgi:hypothetical protein